MGARSFERWLAAAFLAWGALFLVASPSLAEEVLGQRVLYADIEGRVVDGATGQPAAGVSVSLLYETVVTDAAGGFRFQKVPTVHTSEISLQVATDNGMIIGCTSFDIPVGFYPIAASKGNKMEVKVVEPGIDKYVELKLWPVSQADLEEYCGECHTTNPCAEASTFQQVVATKKDLRGIVVKESELEAYREKLLKEGLKRDSYTKLRHQDTHPDGSDMNEVVTAVGTRANLFKQPSPDLKLRVVMEHDVEHRYVICDTCHTRHEPTKYRQFIVKEFEEQSTLCYECHL